MVWYAHMYLHVMAKFYDGDLRDMVYLTGLSRLSHYRTMHHENIFDNFVLFGNQNIFPWQPATCVTVVR